MHIYFSRLQKQKNSVRIRLHKKSASGKLPGAQKVNVVCNRPHQQQKEKGGQLNKIVLICACDCLHGDVAM
jgi:hypothetical protein